MNSCSHNNVRCLNHYEIFRKYVCDVCDGVFICECEKEMVLTLFPHQSKIGKEYGTQERYEVNGFSKVCAKCKGEKEEPHPRAQIYNQKSKIERYYWREIDFTCYKKILNYIKENNLTVHNIHDFRNRFSEQNELFHKEAKETWKTVHKTNPLYQYDEVSQDEFMARVKVQVKELHGEYINEDGKGLWVNNDGRKLSIKEFVADYLKRDGFDVYFCERRIVSTLVSAFLWTPINKPDDKLKLCGIRFNSRQMKSPRSELDGNGLSWFYKPEDFGSHEFYQRKKIDFDEWIDLLKQSNSLLSQYDMFLNASRSLRDYLWVNTEEAEKVTRVFLGVVPDEITIKVIEWAIESFWDRQPGWPDLFVVKNKKYFFVEVKSPNDRLSPDQMKWFEWVVTNTVFPCFVYKVKKTKQT